MNYRNLGHSGLKVSTVSLGSWLTFGNSVDQRSADRIVGTAFEQGVNLFDTADVYAHGEGERVLGQAIASLRRQDLVLATKCFFPMTDGVNDRGLSRKHVFESLDQSLRRLGTDYVDLYQCHRPDPDTPLEETARAMDDLIRLGKVLYWGVSEWPAFAITRVVELCRRERLHVPISNQPRYSLLDRRVEEAVLPASASVGVGQIVFSPLAQGALTGKYGTDGAPPKGSRGGDPRLSHFVKPFLSPDKLRQVDGLVRLARRREMTAAQLALAWCLRRAEVASVIIGATTVGQLEENLAAGDLVLGAELIQEVEDLFPV
jgi:voltage-dependent potassium channel beta subunit